MAAYDVTVKNRGVLEDTLSLSSTAGTLNINKLTLGPGQSQTVQLNVDTSSMEPGKNTVNITATDGKVSDKSIVDVMVNDCHAAALEISPANKTICPFTGFNYTIKLVNKGQQPDSYFVRFKEILENVTLASGQSASWDIPVYSQDSGVYTVTATVESNYTNANATAVLVVQPLGKCFTAEVKAVPQTVNTKVNEAHTVNITVKNTGTVADEYTISVEGPGWAYISPTRLSLGPGVSAEAYLYVSPPREADNQSVKITVNVKSNHAAASTAVTALVGNVKTGQGNISINGLTGAIIYEDDGSMPFWKVAAIAIIALAIVIILIVRFLLLVKS